MTDEIGAGTQPHRQPVVFPAAFQIAQPPRSPRPGFLAADDGRPLPFHITEIGPQAYPVTDSFVFPSFRKTNFHIPVSGELNREHHPALELSLAAQLGGREIHGSDKAALLPAQGQPALVRHLRRGPHRTGKRAVIVAVIPAESQRKTSPVPYRKNGPGQESRRFPIPGRFAEKIDSPQAETAIGRHLADPIAGESRQPHLPLPSKPGGVSPNSIFCDKPRDDQAFPGIIGGQAPPGSQPRIRARGREPGRPFVEGGGPGKAGHGKARPQG